MRRTIACELRSAPVGAASLRRRSCSTARICSRTTRSRARWRHSSARVFSGSSVPSAVRSPLSFSSALRRVVRKVRMPKRAKTDRLARYAGLTGSPDESGKRRRERGLARAGSARVRSIMIQFAWRFVRFQKNSALAQWFAARTADRRASTRKTMIVALARKLLIALWALVTRGEVPEGVILRPAS